jgi:hypothetical protein
MQADEACQRLQAIIPRSGRKPALDMLGLLRQAGKNPGSPPETNHQSLIVTFAGRQMITIIRQLCLFNPADSSFSLATQNINAARWRATCLLCR